MGRERERPGDPPPLPIDSVRYRDDARDYRERRREEAEEPRVPRRAEGEPRRVTEPGADWRALTDRGEYPAEDYHGYESDPPPGKPWGFFLVLSAIVVVAAMYLVTMRSIPDIPPETAVGAMSGALALIGTLVGTYFGIKAGLDGQEKVRQARTRDVDGSRERPRVSTERDGDRGRGEQRVGEQRGPREDGERRRGEPEQRERRRREPEEQRQDWEGASV